MDPTFVYFSQAPQGLGEGGLWATTRRPAFTSARARVPLARYPRVGLSKRLSATLGPCFVYPFSVHHNASKRLVFKVVSITDFTILYGINIEVQGTLSPESPPRHPPWPRRNHESFTRDSILRLFTRAVYSASNSLIITYQRQCKTDLICESTKPKHVCGEGQARHGPLTPL